MYIAGFNDSQLMNHTLSLLDAIWLLTLYMCTQQVRLFNPELHIKQEWGGTPWEKSECIAACLLWKVQGNLSHGSVSKVQYLMRGNRNKIFARRDCEMLVTCPSSDTTTHGSPWSCQNQQQVFQSAWLTWRRHSPHTETQSPDVMCLTQMNKVYLPNIYLVPKM